MTKIFAKNLSNKQVMATDGTELGLLFNIVMDGKNGDLIDLLVKPDMNLDPANYRMQDNQYILIPFTSVRAIKDYIVIDNNIATEKNC